jgi:hypothetical protein
MIFLLVIFLLLLGAAATYILPPERRNLRIVASLLPVAALGVLFAPISLPATFSIPWLPVQLFPQSPLFRADSTGVSFSVYLCCLLMAIEWTRPLRRSPGKIARVMIYLLTISGLIAFSAANVLATALSWAWIDCLSFFADLELNREVEIDTQGIASSIHHSLSIFALNMLGNILILFPVLQTSSDSSLDWSLVWNHNASGLSVILFLVGIVLRLLVAPLQYTFSRSRSVSTGVEILLRILPAAAVLSLLSRSWPPQLTLGAGHMLSPWVCFFLGLVILLAGLQWWIASSPFERRGIFCFLVPIFALLSAFYLPAVDHMFMASGGILILGAGMIFLYSGYLPHRRWLSIFLLGWVVVFAGIPLSPMSLWISHIYTGVLSPAAMAIALPLLLVHILILSSLLRLAFEPVEVFLSNEPLFILHYSLGLAICLIFIFFPGWSAPLSVFGFVFPLFLLAIAIGFWYLSQRLQRINAPLSQFLENVFRLQWLQNVFVSFFGQLSYGISGLESFLSGEGVMLWSLGIALLLYLAFRGG